ncbi:hypothetical protein V6N12_035663 [Hibiscus sabdariffa]|uniref:RNase H type-1 domain-containing protein n=1 Tax=Hibiscus sabdariffa TaxID=183260 RepID=A0ABR2END2_9ROSI
MGVGGLLLIWRDGTFFSLRFAGSFGNNAAGRCWNRTRIAAGFVSSTDANAKARMTSCLVPDSDRRWCKPRVGCVKANADGASLDDLRELLARDWNVVFRYISREQNKVADALVVLGRQGPTGVTPYEHPPEFLRRLLAHDTRDVDNVFDIG